MTQYSLNKTPRTFRLSLAGIALACIFVGGCSGAKDAGGDPAKPGDTKPVADSGPAGGAKRPATTGAGTTVTGDTIPIGVVASLTGDNKPWGDDCVKGAQLAVDDINAAGGINGKKVNLIQADDASKPEQGKTAVEKLIGDDKVIAIVGEVSSGITNQMGPVCQEKGVPDVAVGATKTTLTDIGNVMFRVCYTDDVQGPVMAKFAYKDLGLRKVALMTDKTQIYSTGLSDAFRASFTKLGGEIVAEEFYESKQTQFASQLTNLKAKSPQGVFASGYFNEVGPIVRQASEAGLKIPFFGGDGWDSSQILTTGGDAILGDYFCNHYVNSDPRPEVQKFLTEWKAKFPSVPEPATSMGALGYDGVAIVIDALKRAKGLNSLAVRDALDDTENFKGVSGDIALKGNNGNPPKRAIVVKLTKTGPQFAAAYEPKDLTK